MSGLSMKQASVGEIVDVDLSAEIRVVSNKLIGMYLVWVKFKRSSTYSLVKCPSNRIWFILSAVVMYVNLNIKHSTVL